LAGLRLGGEERYYWILLPAKREVAIGALGSGRDGDLVDDRGFLVPAEADLEAGRNYTFTPHQELKAREKLEAATRELEAAKSKLAAAIERKALRLQLAQERQMRRKHKRRNHLPSSECHRHGPTSLAPVAERDEKCDARLN